MNWDLMILSVDDYGVRGSHVRFRSVFEDKRPGLPVQSELTSLEE